jgi:type IV fimbrial biogenesis protein FimT
MEVRKLKRVLIENSGFTVIQLLGALALMTVMIAIGVPQYVALRPGMQLNGAAREVLGKLMWARSKAVEENNQWVVTFPTNHTVQLLDDTNNNGVADAGESTTTVDISTDYPGVTLSKSVNPSGATFTGVTYNASQLLIQADLNGDGTISTSSTANEQITYAYDSTNKQITRTVGSGSAQILADNITAFTFSYLDSSGTATTTSANIRQVSISITATTAHPDPNYTSNNGYRTLTVTATITPTNLAL